MIACVWPWSERRGGCRIGAAVALSLLFATAAAATPAPAATVTRGEQKNGPPTPTLFYKAAPGEANQVTIDVDAAGNATVSDGAGLATGLGCLPLGPTTASCPGVVIVEAATGDGDDTVTLSGTYPYSELNGGPGADTVTGGPAGDVIFGGLDSSPNTLSGGAGNDLLRGGLGPDKMEGGPGGDLLAGTNGNDVVALKDGAFDGVACGRGIDRVTGDRFDHTTACERLVGVRRFDPENPPKPRPVPDGPAKPGVNDDGSGQPSDGGSGQPSDGGSGQPSPGG